MATPHPPDSQPPMAPGLQNSYGPEMAAAEHNPDYGPQNVTSQSPGNAPEPVLPGYVPYKEQAEKNDAAYAHGGEPPVASTGRRKRILGLPVLWFWVLVGGIIVVLGVALGAGLGVGLSNRSSSSTSSASPPASVTTPTSTSSSSIASTTATSATTSSTSATSSGRALVSICQNADLDLCTTIKVPASSCINFPAEYNDAVSSIDTGDDTCTFYA
ncbi:hypothetical protein diail_11542 [Diaporthe ilicicola]|nr:hypothetical protein diail_11542 [Diaporthe ilicicola]